jgi:hypothetical protein
LCNSLGSICEEEDPDEDELDEEDEPKRKRLNPPELEDGVLGFADCWP